MVEFKKAPAPGEGSPPGARQVPPPDAPRVLSPEAEGAGPGAPASGRPGGTLTEAPPATLGEALAREAEALVGRAGARREDGQAGDGGLSLPFTLMIALAGASFVGWALVRIAWWRARRRERWRETWRGG